MKSPFSCHCGKLNRLKFRQVICPICRTECLVKEPSLSKRYEEMAKWLDFDYHLLPKRLAIRLITHHFWLLKQIKL